MWDFLAGFVNQLAEASGGEVDEQQLNFMLAVVKGIKPRDQMEAMLAAQMAAVHTATMKFSRNLAEAELVEHRDSAERTLNKLMRTFVTQREALKRYRTGGEQTVTVQQVNVGEGGQAIVGNVTQGHKTSQIGCLLNRWPLPTTPRCRCPSLKARRRFRFQPRETRRKNDGGPSAQYWSDACQPALRRQDPLRRVLPIARGPG
jgi:hypothetical protein